VFLDARKSLRSVHRQVRDRYGEFRCLIKADGTCVNNRGGTIGYLNTEDHMAGSRDEEYLG
jgi:hypothetical protein